MNNKSGSCTYVNCLRCCQYCLSSSLYRCPHHPTSLCCQTQSYPTSWSMCPSACRQTQSSWRLASSETLKFSHLSLGSSCPCLCSTD